MFMPDVKCNVFFQSSFRDYLTLELVQFSLNVLLNQSEETDNNIDNVWLEAATGGVLWKQMFLKISQHSQENTCVGNSLW